jgi:hypothetical protein
MQATSTPALAQPKPSAFGALTAAAILVVGIGAGALIGVNVGSTASVSPEAGNGAAYALGVQRAGEIGALTPAQRSLLDQRRGETGAAAAAAADALTADDFLASVGFRREHSGIKPALTGPAMGNGAMIWLGTSPIAPVAPVASVYGDQAAYWHSYGLARPDADETAKRGLAHR